MLKLRKQMQQQNTEENVQKNNGYRLSERHKSILLFSWVLFVCLVILTVYACFFPTGYWFLRQNLTM